MKVLSNDAATRKAIPLVRGFLDYFPAAAAAVAALSLKASEQHGHGDDMYWERPKSSDHADCLVRHLLERGTIDTDGVPHSVKVAWRAMAIAQLELEAAGAPLARAARNG